MPKPAPLFSGTDILTNETFTLSKHKGKVILVCFSGPAWCQPCQVEAPVLGDLWDGWMIQNLLTLGGTVQFVMVNQPKDPPETLSQLKAHLQAYGITFPVLNNDPNWSLHNEYSNIYNEGLPPEDQVGSGVPANFFIDKDLNICNGIYGATPPASAIKNEIEHALSSCGSTFAPVAILTPPWLNAFFQMFGGTIDQGTPDRPIPVDPSERMRKFTREKRDILVSLATSELVNNLSDSVISQELEMKLYRSIENSAKRLQSKLRILNTKIEKDVETIQDAKGKSA